MIDTQKYIKIRNKHLSVYARKDEDYNRFNTENSDMRTAFFRDIDRVLYSNAYLKYKDKTQVFTFEEKNDLLTSRISHVQYVSKIARTIGRLLGLNEDLIEASSLAHDLGHTPFGHVGEKILSKISEENNEGIFQHHAQSVRILLEIEKKNITVEVLDAVLCHNGEILNCIYDPIIKSKEEFLNQYKNEFISQNKGIKPMTLEACVVRISDIIAYIGKDLEDAYKLNMVKPSDLPESVKKELGTENSVIVNTIIEDIVKNSIDQNYIKISENIYNAISELKDFNYNQIYINSYSDKNQDLIEKKFRKLFKKYLDDINYNRKSNIIDFINELDSDYKKNTPARIVIDYISGMTDNYFEKEYSFINKD